MMDSNHQTELSVNTQTQTAGAHPSVHQGVHSKELCTLELATYLALMENHQKITTMIV